MLRNLKLKSARTDPHCTKAYRLVLRIGQEEEMSLGMKLCRAVERNGSGRDIDNTVRTVLSMAGRSQWHRVERM